MAWFLPLLSKLGSAAKTAGKIGSSLLASTGGPSGTMGQVGQAALGMGQGGGFMQRFESLLRPTSGGRDYSTEGTSGIGSLLSNIGLYSQNQPIDQTGLQQIPEILARIQAMINTKKQSK